ncbi:MAG TPA: DUF6600 domain-containing protein [Puia sp.]
MKNIYFILAAGLFIASCGPTTVIQSDSYQPAPAPAPEVSYQSFYDQLSPYGSWINYPGYGYVWMPDAGPDFRPYSSNGSWIYTDAGWTWASNYSWGWAPFHYGRWFFENGYGWLWVPGNEWAPAWVSWRGGGDYYGWAPLGPRISVDVALSSYDPPVNYWNFVPSHYMGNPGWHNYYVNENRNVTIIHQTTIINYYSGTNRSRYSYAPGPDPNEVRRVSGNNFQPVQLREANKPGERISGSQYVIYHPRVNATPAARGDAPGRPATPAPARVEQFSNTRPSTQYPANNPPANSQSGYNQRPATENQGNSQSGYNARPANSQPVNEQPSNSPRPIPANQNNAQSGYNPRPSSNQPVNTQPANNQRTATETPNNSQPAYAPRPANNTAPAQNQNTDNTPAQSNQEAARQMDLRTRKMTQTPPVEQTAQNNVQPKALPAATRVQQTGRPSNVHNPNNGKPVQRTTAPEKKPEQKNDEKPKTREAGSNN